MNSVLRLATIRFRKDFLTTKKCGIIALVRPVTLQPKKQSEISKIENHDERNMKLKRPQSPHLTIYAPQLTSMMSITHRFTGMALAGYTVLFGLATLVLPHNIPHYLDSLAASHPSGIILLIMKLMLAFPMSYHFWNGVRHLIWDLGKFLEIAEVHATAYVVIALSAASSVILSLM